MFSKRLRFVCNAAGGVADRNITNGELQDLLCMAITAVSANRICESVRLKKIEVWAANNAGNASNTIEVEWTKTTTTGGPGDTYSDTAMGLNDVAYVGCKPSKYSLASTWAGTTAQNFLQLTLPQGSIVDVHMDFVLFDTDVPVAVTGAVAAATVGKLYCRALDNQNAAPVILPVGFDSI